MQRRSFFRPSLLASMLSFGLGLLLISQSALADHRFLRGDANGDGVLDISDGIATLQWLFICSDECPLGCGDAADFNDDGVVEMTDAIASFGFLFQGGDPPAAPNDAPGEDATEDDMVCGPDHGVETWQKTFRSDADQFGRSARETADGGFIVAGITRAERPALWDALLVKTDAYGEPVWERSYREDAHNQVYSVRPTSDGGFVFTGWVSAGNTGLSKDVWVVKTDGEGNEEWRRIWGGPAKEEALDVQQTADGGYIVTGYTASFCACDHEDRGRPERVIGPRFGGDIFLLKLDALGNESWARIMTAGGWIGREVGTSVLQTADGGFLLTSKTRSMVIKTDSAGREEWSWDFTGPWTTALNSLQPTSDGGYIVAGYSDSFGSEGGRRRPGPEGRNAYLLRLDGEGEILWDLPYGGDFMDSAEAVVQTADGGFLFAGKITVLGGQRGWLVKVNPEGVEEWSRQLGAEGRSADLLSIAPTLDGGYVATGRMSAVGGNSDFLLVKINAEGHIEEAAP